MGNEGTKITTVAELRSAIADLPDDTPVETYSAYSDYLHSGAHVSIDSASGRTTLVLSGD